MSLSTVSATIQDPSGQAFANGTWQLVFKPTSNTPGLFTDGGVPFTTIFGGTLDGTGSFSQAVARNDTIAPAGSRWVLIVIPNANGQGFSVDLNVNSGAFNASAAINAVITNITVQSTALAHAYKDSEVLPVPNSGALYYDSVLKTVKAWDTANAAWIPLLAATVASTGGVLASTFAGADLGAKINAADAFLGAKGGTIFVTAAAGRFALTPIVLRNNLTFLDMGQYTCHGISIQTGGIKIEGQGYTDTQGLRYGTQLVYTGAAGSDMISILGTAIAHLDGLIIRNIVLDGNNTARYTIRCEKCDAGSLEHVRFQAGVTANSYWVDSLDWKWYNVGSTFMSGFGCIFDGLCGSFDWYGGQFEQGNASANPQIAISGANNRMSFQGLDMDYNANSGGFFLVQGQDGLTSAFASAPANLGQGRPINITIANNVFNYGGAATASGQGADILITDASAAQQPSNIYIENNEFLGSGVGAVSIKADQATRITIDKNFSNGHTAGAATTVVLTANTSLVEIQRLVSGDTNSLTDSSNVAVLEDIINASGLSWRIFSGGARFGAGTTALPSLAFATDTSSGWSRPGAGYWRWSNGGADNTLLSPSGPIINSGKVYGFSNGDSFSSSTLTGLSIVSQGIVGVGNGTAGNVTGELQLKRIKAKGGTTLAIGDFAASAGFGTTAAFTIALGHDQGGGVTITPGGAGIAANPTVTLTFHDGTWGTAPTVVVSRGDLNAPTTGFWIVSSVSATQVVFTFVGLPVSGTSYVLQFVTMGN